MTSEQILVQNQEGIRSLCRKYAVKRLRLYGSALRNDWRPETSDFDFLAEFGASSSINAFHQLMGFTLDLEKLLGAKVDVVDWNAAKNPFFKRHAERNARELFAA